jgi:hypothetical protein
MQDGDMLGFTSEAPAAGEAVSGSTTPMNALALSHLDFECVDEVAMPSPGRNVLLDFSSETTRNVYPSADTRTGSLASLPVNVLTNIASR